jgi:hypothetical protein
VVVVLVVFVVVVLLQAWGRGYYGWVLFFLLSSAFAAFSHICE